MISLIQKHHEQLERLCTQYHVQRLELFGSALTDDRFDLKKSDVDFLVEFLPLQPGEHAKAYFGLLEALQDMFDRHIDLVETRAIKNPYLLQSINQNRKQIYAA